ncbi:response regulator [Granulosicoccus sp. 3-233]|uniref:response regulator n=1 Tax=Granulosicoccus sp. 3-233 TaxID=3417969 RepID=UPI003D32D1D0
MNSNRQDSQTRDAVVLIVDDEPGSLRLLYDTLEKAGYTVLVARDGASAILRLQHTSPDAILLDAIMPGLSGFDTCRRIKTNPLWAHIPILFMTGLSDTSDVLQGFDAGGVDYVIKPIREVEILARLRAHIVSAREIRLAHTAIDKAGLAIVRLDVHSQSVWCSPGVEPILQRLEIGTDNMNDSTWWANLLKENTTNLCIRALGDTTNGETLLLIRPQTASSKARDRVSRAALTPRETEVLSWIAKGKTDREIADILGISPRTVNKHLEHTFTKLGVETRTAAAALANQNFISTQD